MMNTDEFDQMMPVADVADEASNTGRASFTAAGALKLLRDIGTLGLYAAVLLIVPVVMAAVWFTGSTLYSSIMHLGTVTLRVDTTVAYLSAASMLATLGLLIVAGVALSRIEKRRTLLIAGLFAIVWLVVTVMLALVDTWISNKLINADATLLTIGTFVYSALPALPALPIVALAYSATHEKDGQYQTIQAAFGALGMSLLKTFSAVAMFSIEAFFGMNIGVNPVAAVFASLLNATAFAMALGSVEASVHEEDDGGVRLWGVVSVFYAVVIFAIAAEAIITFSGGREGKLQAMAAPLWLEQFAQWAFVSSIGLSAMLIAVSFWRKAHQKRQAARAMAVDAPADPRVTIVAPSLAHRVGAVVARPMALVDDFKRGHASARRLALPSPDGTPQPIATLADDAPAADDLRGIEALVNGLPPDRRDAVRRSVLAYAAGAKDAAGHSKQTEPVRGVDYDATAELVVPADDLVLNAGHNKQVEAAPKVRRPRRTAAEMEDETPGKP